MLTDILTYNLKIVICGTAAGNKSAELKQYYAGRGNRFWKTLHETSLTPSLLTPADYEKLPSFGLGLTDLVKTKSGMDKALAKGDYDLDSFRAKIEKYAPKIICFNGKKAAESYLQRWVDYGLQPETIGKTKLFVAPSTSGAASRYWDLKTWCKLETLSANR